MIKNLIIIGIIIVCLAMVLTTFQNATSFKNETIKSLVRQSSRWSLASMQDQNEIIAVLHANYGAAYLWALRDIATDDDIEKITGIDIIKFKDKITNAQDMATKRLTNSCPDLVPPDEYLARLAGDM